MVSLMCCERCVLAALVHSTPKSTNHEPIRLNHAIHSARAQFIFIFTSFTSKSPELRVPLFASPISWGRVSAPVVPAGQVQTAGGYYIPIIDCQKTIFSKWRGGGPATTGPNVKTMFAFRSRFELIKHSNENRNSMQRTRPMRRATKTREANKNRRRRRRRSVFGI